MVADLRFFLHLLRLNLKAARSMRLAYTLRSVFAIVTHSIYIVLWFVFFDAIPSLGGWQLEHILLAYGMAIAAWGIVSFLAYGLRTLPRQIETGELDTYLTQPRPVLLNIAMSSPKITGPGEVIFGLALAIYAAVRADVALGLFALALACACLVFASIILAFASLGFWVRDFHSSAEELYFNFNLLSTRPAPIFTGWLKLLIFTVVPVGFMTHLPLQFLLDNQSGAIFATIAGTCACMAGSYALFRYGLGCYESGNRFTAVG